jgi:hypothetical protein
MPSSRFPVCAPRLKPPEFGRFRPFSAPLWGGFGCFAGGLHTISCGLPSRLCKLSQIPARINDFFRLIHYILCLTQNLWLWAAIGVFHTRWRGVRKPALRPDRKSARKPNQVADLPSAVNCAPEVRAGSRARPASQSADSSKVQISRIKRASRLGFDRGAVFTAADSLLQRPDMTGLCRRRQLSSRARPGRESPGVMTARGRAQDRRAPTDLKWLAEPGALS